MATDIGAKLREFRKASGMSQMKLADKVGVSYQQIQKYEKGMSKLSVPRLIQLADIFRLPIMAFIDEDHKPGENLAAANFSPEEVDLVLSFRRITSKRLRTSLQAIVGDIVHHQNNKARVK